MMKRIAIVIVVGTISNGSEAPILLIYLYSFQIFFL